VQCYNDLIDVSEAETPSEALLLLAQLMQQAPALAKEFGWNHYISVNTGYLVLSPAQVRRVRKLVEEADLTIQTFYTQVPQTQQVAVSQGFVVDELSKQRLQALLHPASEFLMLPEPPPTAQPHPTEEALPNADEATTTVSPFSAEGVSVPALPQPNALPSLEAAAPILDETATTSAPMATEATSLPSDTHPTQEVTWIHGTLRSGRLIETNGHLVVLGDVNRGAELRAKGDIVIWGELKGIAHAGFPDNTAASIRALRLDALQLRIADVIARRPDKAPSLTKGFFSALKDDSHQCLPEVALVEGDEIVITSSLKKGQYS
jgi:septum site-determining protein MinC